MPSQRNLKFSFLKKYRKTKSGSQIIVGFMVKTNTEEAKSNLKFIFPLTTSFKTIRDNAIAGKSGLGD